MVTPLSLLGPLPPQILMSLFDSAPVRSSSLGVPSASLVPPPTQTIMAKAVGYLEPVRPTKCVYCLLEMGGVGTNGKYSSVPISTYAWMPISNRSEIEIRIDAKDLRAMRDQKTL